MAIASGVLLVLDRGDFALADCWPGAVRASHGIYVGLRHQVNACRARPGNPPTQSPRSVTSKTPLAIAMSRSGKSLYVACYDASALDIIDLTSATFLQDVDEPGANPEGVAVGRTRWSSSAPSNGNGQAVLTTYDPSASGSSALQAVLVSLPAPTTPQLPPPNGYLWYFASKSQLQATRDGARIIGVKPNGEHPARFLSSMWLLPRCWPAAALRDFADSGGFPDGSEFLSGPCCSRLPR